MANDRIFLRCKTCGSHISVMKYYPGEPVDIPHEGLGGDMVRFMKEHAKCRREDETYPYGLHLGRDARFELVTEDELHGTKACSAAPADAAKRLARICEWAVRECGAKADAEQPELVIVGYVKELRDEIDELRGQISEM